MSTHAALVPLGSIRSAPPVRPLRALPLAMQKAGCALLHPQCWLWGHDVRRVQGNLLLEYGFERVRPPKWVNGCSQYTLHLDEQTQLRLWGFGMFAGRAVASAAAWEGFFVNRYTFSPCRVVLGGNVWENRVFKHLPRSTDWALLARCVGAILDYEDHLQQSPGPDYRKQCLYSWEDPSLTARDLRLGWNDLRYQVAQLQAMSSTVMHADA